MSRLSRVREWWHNYWLRHHFPQMYQWQRAKSATGSGRSDDNA